MSRWLKSLRDPSHGSVDYVARGQAARMADTVSTDILAQLASSTLPNTGASLVHFRSTTSALPMTIQDKAEQIVHADDYATLQDAVDAVFMDYGRIKLSKREYTSDWQDVATNPNPNILTRKNIIFDGEGPGEFNASNTALVDGSIIKGSLFCMGSGIRFHNIGFDSGADFCNANYAGAPQECLLYFDVEQLTLVPTPLQFGMGVRNCKMLGKGTGKTGDPSDVHALLVENYQGGYIENVETRFCGAATVVKSSFLNINGVYGRGSFKYTLLIKSEGYSNASFNTVTNVHGKNLLNDAPNIAIAADFDTGPVMIQASSADATGNVLSNITMNGCTVGVFLQGLGGNRVTDTIISNVHVQTAQDAIFLTSNTVLRTTIVGIQGNVANRGCVIGTSSTWTTIALGRMTGVNGYSYENSGVESALASCASESPAVSHIRIIAGDLEILGGFKESGTGTLLTTLGGTISGFNRGIVDELTSPVVYLNNGRMGVANPTPATIADIVLPVNAPGLIVGPIAGSMNANDYVSITLRGRNSVGGAVAGDGYSALAEVRGYQTAAASNTGGLALATRTNSGSLSNKVLIDDVGDMYPATTNAYKLGKTGALWSEINCTVGNVTTVTATTVNSSVVNVTTEYRTNGTKVLGARDTGWTAGTGTANKGAFATYTAPDISAAYVEAEVQGIADATQANARRIKALEDMLRTHGLMN